ncbi:MAG: hypothetical protein ABEI97_05355, partial [Candidatus Nanohaloarchaea archaeon]
DTPAGGTMTEQDKQLSALENEADRYLTAQDFVDLSEEEGRLCKLYTRGFLLEAGILGTALAADLLNGPSPLLDRWMYLAFGANTGVSGLNAFKNSHPSFGRDWISEYRILEDGEHQSEISELLSSSDQVLVGDEVDGTEQMVSGDAAANDYDGLMNHLENIYTTIIDDDETVKGMDIYGSDFLPNSEEAVEDFQENLEDNKIVQLLRFKPTLTDDDGENPFLEEHSYQLEIYAGGNLVAVYNGEVDDISDYEDMGEELADSPNWHHSVVEELGMDDTETMQHPGIGESGWVARLLVDAAYTEKRKIEGAARYAVTVPLEIGKQIKEGLDYRSLNGEEK